MQDNSDIFFMCKAKQPFLEDRTSVFLMYLRRQTSLHSITNSVAYSSFLCKRLYETESSLWYSVKIIAP